MLPRAKYVSPPAPSLPRLARCRWAALVSRMTHWPGLRSTDEVGRVVGEVVGVLAAAVPQRHEDKIVVRRTLADAVDQFLAGRRAPGVGGVAVVGARAVVRPVHVLQRGDVVLHEGGRMIGCIVAVAGVVARKLAIGHHRVFVEIVIGRQRRELDAVAVLRDMAVLEAEIVPGLVHDAGRILEAAEHRVVVARDVVPAVALGIGRRERRVAVRMRELGRVRLGGVDRVQPGVRGDGRVVGVVDRVGFRIAQERARIRRLGEGQVGEARDVGESRAHGRHLGRVERTEAVDRLVVVIFSRGAGGEREVEAFGAGVAPRPTPENAVDVLIA